MAVEEFAIDIGAAGAYLIGESSSFLWRIQLQPATSQEGRNRMLGGTLAIFLT